MQTRFASFLSLAALLAALGGCAVATEDAKTGSSSSELSGRPYFEVFEGAGGAYFFHLAAGNHEIVLSSESYQRRLGALNGVLSVLDHGGFRGNYEVRESANGQFYFNLQAANGRVIGTSELYTTRAGADGGVEATITAIADYLDFWADPSGDRFEVFPGKDGQFYFHLKAANGEIMLFSEGYSSEAAAYNGAFSVADNGLDADRYEVLEAQSGDYYFNVVAANGQVIGTSELYATRSNATRARDRIMEILLDVELL